MANDILQIGITGAGGFAHFAAMAFIKVPGIKITAVTDINEAAAMKMRGEFGAKVCKSYDQLLEDTAVDLVYIATPPYLHYEQSKKALLAGKHVICEKPAALHISEAEELRAITDSSNLLYVVNLMQRYNSLYEVVKKVINQNLLGRFLHGFFENYASDENLSEDHWFWNESKSGGIFIEHGVHFFDMFEGWLGEGKVLQAWQLRRPHTKKIFDRVQATVMYSGGIVNFYHGFDQAVILDRQELRLEFEKGDITLYEWVPVKMKLHGLLTTSDFATLSGLLGDFSFEPDKESSPFVQKVRGRFTDIFFNDHITINYGKASDKQSRYQQMLMAMIQDQWEWIKDRNHIRVIDASNAVSSLKMAEEATTMSQKIMV